MIGMTARRYLLGLTIGLIGAATVVAAQPRLALRSHRELLQEPLDVPESGTYRLWAWAEAGKPIHLSAGGKDFNAEAQPGPGFRWVELGKLELKAQTRLDVTFDQQAARIGYVALGQGAADPVRYCEATRVFPDKPGPIDDYRLSDSSLRAARDYPWKEKFTLRVKGSRRDDELRALLHSEDTRQGWMAYAKDLKEHMLFCLGLWPAPRKAPLNARVFDTINHEDYTVSKAYFESFPGVFVCGNLYRPVGKKEKCPVVLRTMGHWGNGRFMHDEVCSAAAQMINFARQGYVAFCWDVIGMNDMDQLPHTAFCDVAWGLGATQLHTWNGIRVVDWISTLPEVDPERIGMTGASGGGTATLYLTAVEERIAASAPVSWGGVSNEDGCSCGVAPGMKVETYNPEIMALAAPRPLIMLCAADGWFPSMPYVEYPYLREIYKFYDAVDNVAVDSSARGGHNYNAATRNILYKFFGKHLLGAADPGKLVERPCTPDSKEKLLVFSQENPRPEGAPT